MSRRSLCLLLSSTCAVASLGAGPRTAPDPLGRERAGVLVALFERCLESRDPDEYAQQVSASFRESTLVRWLESGDVATRRACVYALGQFGSYKTNAAVARGLRDADPIVRAMADRALRPIWYRAGTAEQNEKLRLIMVDIERRSFEEAIAKADALVKEAPDFAEAYNQRAIANFFLFRPAESADDCRKTLELNPYHLGALGGLAQCLVRLDRRGEAIAVYRRASGVSPFDESLKAAIVELEAAR